MTDRSTDCAGIPSYLLSRGHYSLCKGCGEIFPYPVTSCPVCRAECVNLEEHHLEQKKGFHGGKVVKWFACVFLLILVGLFAYILSVNVSDKRLLGQRDQIVAEIERLKVEENLLNERLDPSRREVIKEEALRQQQKKLTQEQEELATRARSLDEREKTISERERKARNLSDLESDLKERNQKLQELIASIQKASQEKSRADDDLKRLRQAQADLADRIAANSATWTNLTRGVASFAQEAVKLSELKESIRQQRMAFEVAQGNYITLTNAVFGLKLDRDGVSNEVDRLKVQHRTLEQAVTTNRSAMVALANERDALRAEMDIAGRQKAVAETVEALGRDAEARRDEMEKLKEDVSRLEKTIQQLEATLNAAAEQARIRIEAAGQVPRTEERATEERE